MPPPIQKLQSFMGISKQAVKGTPSVSPFLYGLGVISGKIFDIPITHEDEPMTLNGGPSDRFTPAVNRTDVIPGAAFKTRLFSRSGGLLLFGALGTDSTGAGPPYTHTQVPAQDLPYLTLAGRIGAEYPILSDVKVDELTIAFAGRKPVEMDVKLMGCTPAFNGAAWAVTNDDTVQPYHTPLGGTLSLSIASNTPAVARISEQTIHIANNLVGVPLAKSNLPDDVFPGQQVVDGTCKLIPTDMTDFRKAVTGTGSGVALSAVAVYGSFSTGFTLDSNNAVTLAALRVAFLIDFPDADPKGGPAELNATYKVVRPLDGSAAITGTVITTAPAY
jgi:hypothetical protein